MGAQDIDAICLPGVERGAQAAHALEGQGGQGLAPCLSPDHIEGIKEGGFRPPRVAPGKLPGLAFVVHKKDGLRCEDSIDKSLSKGVNSVKRSGVDETRRRSDRFGNPIPKRS